MFPTDRADTTIRLRGMTLRARWNPRTPEHSGTLYVGRHTLTRLVANNEILTITTGNDGHTEVN
jgi:hypothetical protein